MSQTIGDPDIKKCHKQLVIASNRATEGCIQVSHSPAGKFENKQGTTGGGTGVIPCLTFTNSQWFPPKKARKMGSWGLSPGGLVDGRKVVPLLSPRPGRNTTGRLYALATRGPASNFENHLSGPTQSELSLGSLTSICW